MNNRLISLPIVYNQSYGVDNLGNPLRFSETFVFYRLYIAKQNKVRLSNIKTVLFTQFRKRGGDTTPKIAFFTKNNFEAMIEIDHLNIITDETLTPITNQSELDISPMDVSEYPIKFAYYDIPIISVGDFKITSIFSSISKVNKISIPLTQFHASIIEESYLTNTDMSDYIYVVSYCPLLLQTEIHYTGHLLFNLE